MTSARAAALGLCAALIAGPATPAMAQAPAPAETVAAGAGGPQNGQAQGQPPGGSGLRLGTNGRPTLQLPFGEIQFRGRLAGLVQTPTHDRGADGPDPTWQTRRLQIEGTLFTRLEFEVSREFGDATEPERDAFANLRVNRAFELRAGQFKLPFGRDALTGGANLDLVTRSLAGRQLAPGRDTGVMAHGRLARRRVAYQAGYFTKDGDNARTSQTRGGRDALAARVVVSPFVAGDRPALAGLQVGAAAVTSQIDDRLGLRGHTVFEEGVFFNRVFVNGRRLRRGIEAGWGLGPVSLAWEHMTVSDERLGMGANGEALPSVRATGWYVSGAWVLTGERKQGRVEPEHNLFGDGLGALELVGRVERLAFDAGADTAAPPAPPLLPPPAANADRVITIGLAWYLNRYFKINGNAVFESVTDPERSPAPQDGGRFPTAVVQFQVAL